MTETVGNHRSSGSLSSAHCVSCATWDPQAHESCNEFLYDFVIGLIRRRRNRHILRARA